MMATCPPLSHLMEHPDEPYPHKVRDYSAADLIRLLALSYNLSLNGGELTPVMALAEIYRHPRIGELSLNDLEAIKCELGGKVRCYG